MNFDFDFHGLYGKFLSHITVSKKKSSMVDGIFCIYTDVRENYIKNIFDKFGLGDEVIYVKAITNSHLNPNIYKNYTQKGTILPFTKLPVHLSYLLCMYHAYIYDMKHILIFEDDVYFTISKEELQDYVNTFIYNIQGDVLYLGLCWANKSRFKQTEYKNFLQSHSNNSILCKHGILHNTGYFHHFFKNHAKLGKNSDVFFNKYFVENKIKRYSLDNLVVFQNREELGSLNGNNKKTQISWK